MFRSAIVRIDVRGVGLIVALSAAALAFSRSDVRATTGPDPVTDERVVLSDLDTYDDARLMRDLRDELNDVLEEVEDDDTDNETLASLMLDALGDDGDTGYETDITLEDLEAEMEEAGTSLEEVIAQALGGGVSDAGAAASTRAVPMIIRAGREVGIEMQSDHPRTASKLDRGVRGIRDGVRRRNPGERSSGTSGV